MVRFVELELDLLAPEILLLTIFDERLLIALRRFLDLKSAFLELLIFIFYPYPFLFALTCFFVRSGSILVYVIYIDILL